MARKRETINDEDRRGFVENYEPLYCAYRASGAGLYRWVRENRVHIDAVYRHKVFGETGAGSR